MGIHHRQYEGKAFFLNDKRKIVGRHVRGRIMVDANGFQEKKPDYPCPRVHKVKKRYPWAAPPDTGAQIKLEDIHQIILKATSSFAVRPSLALVWTAKHFVRLSPPPGRHVAYKSQWSLLSPISEQSNGASLRLMMSESRRRRRSPFWASRGPM